MLVQKEAVTILPPANRQKKLDNLYARRLVIDSLIQSLQDYDRLRVKRLKIERKTA